MPYCLSHRLFSSVILQLPNTWYIQCCLRKRSPLSRMNTERLRWTFSHLSASLSQSGVDERVEASTADWRNKEAVLFWGLVCEFPLILLTQDLFSNVKPAVENTVIPSVFP